MRSLRQTALAITLWLSAWSVTEATKVLAAPCPSALASIEIVLTTADGTKPLEALVSGYVTAASCEAAAGAPSSYFSRIRCEPSRPESCRIRIDGLQPGGWAHTVLGLAGEATGQLQTQRSLLLDRTAGEQTVAWPMFRSIATVTTLNDSVDCQGCLRDALQRAGEAPKPHLIQFASSLIGTITLADRLPELECDDVTIDGRAFDGLPLKRTIDANSIGRATLRITGARNRIIGLRLIGVGGDSDSVVIEGPKANANVLESLQVIGRALTTCESNGRGCVIDGICHGQSEVAQGVCGDDGVAVRDDAGTLAPNLLIDSDISGAFDKGVKSSEGGVVIVRRSRIHHNADGGMQATLGGQMEAIENSSEDNQGTSSANGIAANGARLEGGDPARLVTRGNIIRHNSLRGISVRSLSIALLRDDFICGNRGSFGIALLDAAGFAPQAEIRGVAAVLNSAGGVLLLDTASADLGTSLLPGQNVFAFNGPRQSTTPTDLRNMTNARISAVGNFWENCGRSTHCDESRVSELDIFAPTGSVDTDPAAPSVRRAPPEITSISPSNATAGELVRIYGSGFDALSGNGPASDCASIAERNTCPPHRGNCVFIDGLQAPVIAVTPTMLVIRAPLTCVEPVDLTVRTRWTRGFARASFCLAETTL